MLKAITLNRALYAAAAMFFAALGAGIVLLIVTLLEPEPDTVLGAYQSPFEVLTNPAINGIPAVVRGERCVTSDHDEEVRVTVTLQKVDGTYRHSDQSNAKQTRPKGCNTTTQVVGIPADAPPGRYIINGLSIAVRTGEGRIWWSEEFEVQRPSNFDRLSVSRAAEACGDQARSGRDFTP